MIGGMLPRISWKATLNRGSVFDGVNVYVPGLMSPVLMRPTRTLRIPALNAFLASKHLLLTMLAFSSGRGLNYLKFHMFYWIFVHICLLKNFITDVYYSVEY